MFKTVNFKFLKPLIMSLFISLGTGYLSSSLSGDIRAVFEGLVKPGFAPPAWVFPVVWTILYIFLGIAAFLIYQKGIKSPGVKEALIYYVLSLIFTFFWPLMFFRWNLYLFALIWLVALLIIASVTFYKFIYIDKSAAILYFVYLLWLIYAFALNFSFYLLNR